MKRRNGRGKTSRAASRGGGQLRIIAGHWRGRRLAIADLDGLRPTGNRLRETLFNWLQVSVADARCLDLFAGTGALGLEALSRGAAHCDFVDIQPGAIEQLHGNVDTLDARDRCTVFQRRWDDFLDSAPGRYDIAFVDPPFDAGLHDAVIDQLVAAGCLRESALLYLEYPRDATPRPRSSFEVYRDTRSGAVGASLWRARNPREAEIPGDEHGTD